MDMINVNDFNPQTYQDLQDRVSALEKMIYDLNGKSVRQDSLNGDRVIVDTLNGNTLIAKTVNGDRITGGVIEGALLQTINPDVDKSGNYAFLQKQWLEIALNNKVLMDIGIIENSSGNPVIHFYHPDGTNYFSIWGNNTDNFVTIGGANTEIKAFGTWNFDNAKINGSQIATLNDIPSPLTP